MRHKVHSTGHESRLNRRAEMKSGGVDLSAYAREELVAELGAAYLCAETGIAPKTLDDAASYISGWLKVLKDNPKILISCASAAQRAVDFLLGRVAPLSRTNGDEEGTTSGEDAIAA